MNLHIEECKKAYIFRSQAFSLCHRSVLNEEKDEHRVNFYS